MIDARTTAVDNTQPVIRRNRRLAVAVAVVAVAVAAGAIVWITVDGDSASADRQGAGAARSTEAAASPSDAAPSESVSPATTDPTADASHVGGASSAGAGSGSATQPGALALPAGWEARSFQGITFSVPPGAQAPDLLDPGNADAPATFVWTGPSVGGGVNAQISVWIYSADRAPVLGTEYQSVTVPGADQAHVRTGATGSEPPLTAVDVHILSGGRFINLVGMLPAGAAGELMARDLVASLSIG